MTIRHGKIAKPVRLASVRPLVRDDLQKLKAKRNVVTSPMKLRDSHHRIARLAAAGLRPGEIQARSGYSHTRIMTLMASPAFEELIAKYRNMVNEAFIQGIDDYYDIATQNMLKAERQIADRLDEADEAGETLPVRELVAISRDAADRFGYGKKQTNTNINVDFAAEMERVLARSGKTIEVRAASVSGAVGKTPPNRGPTGQVQPLRRRA